jgi:agmatinase
MAETQGLEADVSGNGFIGATDRPDTADAILYGMPMDWTTSFRPGTRLGPRRIREVSVGLEEYSPYLDRELQEVAYYDAGDIPLPFGNPRKSVELIRNFVHNIVRAGKLPVGMGGEHLVSWGPIQAVYEAHPDLALIHIDAHADLREHYEGEAFSHASVIRKAVDLLGGKNVYQFGIRSGTKEEFRFARENTHFYPFTVLAPLREAVKTLGDRPVYVTVDIDVVDPAFAPGTGTAEAGGITAAELIQSIHALRGLRIAGFDLVEVAPPLDPTEQTQILAAKLIRELLLVAL